MVGYGARERERERETKRRRKKMKKKNNVNRSNIEDVDLQIIKINTSMQSFFFKTYNNDYFEF